MTTTWHWSVLTLLCLSASSGCKKEDPPKETPATATASAAADRVTPQSARRVSAPAERHLPAGCSIAIAVDASRLFDNAVIGTQLLTALGDAEAAPSAVAHPKGSPQKAFIDMLDALALRPKRDLRGVAACIRNQDQKSSFAVVLSGDFPLGVPEAMQRHAPDKERYRATKIGEQTAIERDGKHLVQAPDHAVAFGDDTALLQQTFVTSDVPTYSFLVGQDVAVVMAPGAIPPEAAADAFGKALSQARSVRAGVNLGAGKLTAKLAMGTEKEAADVEKTLKQQAAQFIKEMGKAPAMVRASAEPMLRAMSGLSTQTEGTELTLSVQLEPGFIETALQQLVMMSMMAQARGGPPGGGFPGGGFPGGPALPGGMGLAPLPTVNLSK